VDAFSASLAEASRRGYWAHHILQRPPALPTAPSPAAGTAPLVPAVPSPSIAALLVSADCAVLGTAEAGYEGAAGTAALLARSTGVALVALRTLARRCAAALPPEIAGLPVWGGRGQYARCD